MTGIVETTGRRMTRALEAALDGMPNRRHRITALSEVALDTPLGPLFRAVALELTLVGLREADALLGMERALADDSDEDPPMPPGVGRALEVRFHPDGTPYLVDPETGEPQ